MKDSVLILGGDLFSLIAAQTLGKNGFDVTWVSSRKGLHTNYGRELNKALMSHPQIAKFFSYNQSSQEEAIESIQNNSDIKVLESADLLNIMDNGSIVDVRLKIDGKTVQLRTQHLLATNRYFALQKKLRLEYEAVENGNCLSELNISRCHFMGEVSHLYFQKEQIDTWFEQLNRFIKIYGIRGSKKGQIKAQNRLKGKDLGIPI